MRKIINYANIINLILGEEQYKLLLTEVAKENNRNSSLDSFFDEVFNKYCFVILMLGMSKKVEIGKYKFRTNLKTIEKSSFEFAKKYEKYVKIIENEKFNFIKDIL